MNCASQHEKTCDTSGPMTLQGQRKGRRRPLNWILGVLPRHLKIPLPRPSFQPLKQTKEADSDLHCPLVRCPFSDFRPEPWEQNKEWRLEKLPNNNELWWTTMNYEKFELIDSHSTYCDQNKILEVLATSRKNAHKPSKPSDQLLSLSWKLAHWKHISISLKSLKSIIVPGSDGGSPELWLQH